MNFFKNNLVAMIVALFAFGGLSLATTYNRPYDSTDYAGGTKAVGAYVNAEFQGLTDFLNAGNLSSINIANGGIATANIAGGAVTPAKMARLTDDSFSILSGSISSVSTTATVTGLEFSITTSGRPVAIYVRGLDLPNVSGYFAVVSDTSTSMLGSVYLYRNGVVLQNVRIGGTVPSGQEGASNRFFYPPSAFNFIDNPVAGTYTYSIRVSVDDANSSISLADLQVIAYEL